MPPLPFTSPSSVLTVPAVDTCGTPLHAVPVAASSIHQYAKMPWAELFADAEAIFRGAGGRPHWAKRHRLSRADVAALYPMAGRYTAVRRAADPQDRKSTRLNSSH